MPVTTAATLQMTMPQGQSQLNFGSASLKDADLNKQARISQDVAELLAGIRWYHSVPNKPHLDDWDPAWCHGQTAHAQRLVHDLESSGRCLPKDVFQLPPLFSSEADAGVDSQTACPTRRTAKTKANWMMQAAAKAMANAKSRATSRASQEVIAEARH